MDKQFRPRRYKTCLWRFANSKDAKQPEHAWRLVSAFAISLTEMYEIKCGSRGGTGGPDPPPWKITSYMGFYRELAIGPPLHWKKLDPLLNLEK